MVDLILAGTIAGTFCGGWWCRGKFGSAKKMWDAAVAKLHSL